MFRVLRAEIDAIFQRDPAAKSVTEVLLCYSGLHAVLLHRIAHRLHLARFPLLARVVSQLGRMLTGIEIHPGATIGRRLFIDHGMGVVIGETAEIGDDVLLYQGVTLGGTGKDKGRRHPTIGNHVVIGAGARVLGNIRVGDHVKIGAGSVVVHPVPPHSTVVGVPGRVVRMRGAEDEQVLEHGNLPDPDTRAIENLSRQLRNLELQVALLMQHASEAGPGNGHSDNGHSGDGRLAAAVAASTAAGAAGRP